MTIDAEAADTGPVRVLIVEDSPTQAAELQLVLEDAGFATEIARDGQAGLEAFRRGRVDVVLSDVLMPHLSGYGLCRAIRAEPGGRDVPVILLTSLRDPTDIVEGLACGADNFLTKPYEAGFLVGRVRNILANRRLRSAGRPAGGLDFTHARKTDSVTSDKEQILDLLISTVEEFVRTQRREYDVRLAEESSRKGQRLLQAALDAVTARIAVLDAAGTVVAVNAAWREGRGECPLWGEGCGVGTDYRLRCPEIAGRAEGDLRAAAEGAAAVLAGGPARFESEYRIVDSAGVARWFHTKVSRLENTPLARFVVDHFEVTERRRAEQERAARIEAEAVNRAKDQFLAAVSHDLRSPLNAVVGYVALLRTGALDADETRHALEVIDRNVRAQTQLIDDLLDVSRAITGKLHLEIAEVRPDELVRGAVDTVALAARNRNVRLESALDAQAPVVHGDPRRLQQVLNNLLTNALKFTPDGGRVTVRLCRSDRAVRISVADTGRGIRAELLPHVFDRFRQAEDAKKLGGLGLGLAIVRHIVQLHGGQVWAESDGEGRGATFTVELPVAPPAAPARVGRSGAAG